MLQVMRYGSRSKLAMASGVGVSALNKFPASKQQTRNDETTYGMNVTHYTSPFGSLNLVYHKLLEGSKYGGYILVVDMDEVAYRYLGQRRGQPRHEGAAQPAAQRSGRPQGRVPDRGRPGVRPGERARRADRHHLVVLRTHARNGDPNEGFWEVTPSAPAVTMNELQAAMLAATNFEVDKLQAMLEQEEAGWAREELLTPLRAALERFVEIKAAMSPEELARLEGEV
jgi:hypothetical protein